MNESEWVTYFQFLNNACHVLVFSFRPMKYLIVGKKIDLLISRSRVWQLLFCVETKNDSLDFYKSLLPTDKQDISCQQQKPNCHRTVSRASSSTSKSNQDLPELYSCASNTICRKMLVPERAEHSCFFQNKSPRIDHSTPYDSCVFRWIVILNVSNLTLLLNNFLTNLLMIDFESIPDTFWMFIHFFFILTQKVKKIPVAITVLM